MPKEFEPSQISQIRTRDGSPTLYNPYFDEHYHSLHGARQESEHVFIDAGLKAISTQNSFIRIFELGFGTGLNAWLTCMVAEELQKKIHYVSLELYPLPTDIWQELHYTDEANLKERDLFTQLHEADWDKAIEVADHFVLEKRMTDYLAFVPAHSFDLIYFDAFAPEAQSDLWTLDAMKRLRSWCNPGAVFVTYSAKGDVRRALMQAGFEVEKLPGPPGKREMLKGRAN